MVRLPSNGLATSSQSIDRYRRIIIQYREKRMASFSNSGNLKARFLGFSIVLLFSVAGIVFACDQICLPWAECSGTDFDCSAHGCVLEVAGDPSHKVCDNTLFAVEYAVSPPHVAVNDDQQQFMGFVISEASSVFCKRTRTCGTRATVSQNRCDVLHCVPDNTPEGLVKQCSSCGPNSEWLPWYRTDEICESCATGEVDGQH